MRTQMPAINAQQAGSATDYNSRFAHSPPLHTRAQLLTALANDRFLAHAQPIVRLDTREIARYELLLRMRRNDGGLSYPASFLAAIQQRGLMSVLDRWMARTAVQLATRIGEQSDLRLHVNLSPQSLEDIALYDGVVSELELTGASPSNLIFELTETSDVDCTSGVPLRMVEQLKSLGCGIALDDFGVGFNTLLDLKYLPIDCVKIDGRFIRDLSANRFDRRIVGAIGAMAQRLGLETVAEYVTDAASADYLAEIGIDFAQGELFGMARPLEEIGQSVPARHS